ATGGSAGTFAFWMLVVAALFTSFYSWRLIHLTFHGQPRWGAAAAHAPAGAHGHDDHSDDHAHSAHEDQGHHVEPHESPRVMLVPLFVLAVGAVLAGAVFYDNFFGHYEHVAHFFGGSVVVNEALLDAAHHVPLWVKWSATIAMLIGFAAAWYMYIR